MLLENSTFQSQSNAGCGTGNNMEGLRGLDANLQNVLRSTGKEALVLTRPSFRCQAVCVASLPETASLMSFIHWGFLKGACINVQGSACP